jgi:quercetin dioxygenase-like cupin family protein
MEEIGMRRGFLLFLFVLTLAVPSALAQDPVKVDSTHYTVEVDNSKVRVLRVKVGPGEKTPMHGHPDSVLISRTDGRVKFSYPGGKTEEVTMKAGDVMWVPAVKHAGENLSDQPLEVIVVELKAKRVPHKVPKKSTNTNSATNSNTK